MLFSTSPFMRFLIWDSIFRVASPAPPKGANADPVPPFAARTTSEYISLPFLYKTFWLESRIQSDHSPPRHCSFEVTAADHVRSSRSEDNEHNHGHGHGRGHGKSKKNGGDDEEDEDED